MRSKPLEKRESTAVDTSPFRPDNSPTGGMTLIALMLSLGLMSIGMVIASTNPSGLAYIAGVVFLALGTIGILSFFSFVYETKTQEAYKFLLDVLGTATLRNLMLEMVRSKKQGLRDQPDTGAPTQKAEPKSDE